MAQLTVALSRLVVEEIQCIFFGKRTKLITLRYKGAGHPSGSSYPIEDFEAKELESELDEVERGLDLDSRSHTPRGRVFNIGSGRYVHIYTHTRRCSGLKMSECGRFFVFESAPQMTAFEKEGAIDVKPFVYSQSQLKHIGGRYDWVDCPREHWDWDEAVWTPRLHQCLQHSTSLAGIKVVPAYKWQPQSYHLELTTLFPNVMDLKVAPFHGMSDIVLVAKSVAVIHSQEPSPAVCVGMNRGAACPVTVSFLRKLPEKLGELLASTYLFATQNYLNNLHGTPPANTLKWRAYGILAIRATGVLYVQMDLDNDSCRVKLLHDSDGVFTLSAVLDHVVKNIK